MNKKYIFTDQTIKNPYKFVFLCGSYYNAKDSSDKRKVLKKFLEEEDGVRPIILEENFGFAQRLENGGKKKKPKYLLYDDIYLQDLYSVEMLMSYLASANVIIHESIATGAETGLFLSDPDSIYKTCLLIPDVMSVEEKKYGNFMRLAYSKHDPKLRCITFYPRVEENVISEYVRNWHTYFVNDTIGEHLGNEIRGFLDGVVNYNRLCFTRSSEQKHNGDIYYKITYNKAKNRKILKIQAYPAVLQMCMYAAMNIIEVNDGIFGTQYHKIKYYVKYLTSVLKELFINTVQEIEGIRVCDCEITPISNMKDIAISNIVGLSLYLAQAAGFIEMERNPSEPDTIMLSKKVYGKQGFFFKRYKDCIGIAVETRIG